MKKIIRLILIMFLAFSSLKANAVILTNTQIESEIKKQVTETYRKYTDAELSIEIVTLPFKDLYVPNGEITYKIESFSTKFVPRELEKVTIFVNGKPVKVFNAPVVVKVYENVLIASNFINIGQQINTSTAKVKRMEISNILDYPLRVDALGKDIMAKKAFREGEIIDKRFIKLKPDIVRNARVTVMFNTNNLTVSTEATALSDGTIGDSICLINKNYNRVYTGKVIGENKVLVKI